MLLFRLFIAFVLIVLFVPLGHDRRGDSVDDSAGGAVAAIAAASAAVSDVRGFCDRQPGACAAGTQALSAMGERARAGAEALTTLVSREETGAAAVASAADGETAYSASSVTALSSFLNRIANANVQPVASAAPAAPARDTLLPGDKRSAWQKATIKPGRN